MRVLFCIPEFWVLYSKRYMGSVRLGMSRPKLPKLKVARKLCDLVKMQVPAQQVWNETETLHFYSPRRCLGCWTTLGIARGLAGDEGIGRQVP